MFRRLLALSARDSAHAASGSESRGLRRVTKWCQVGTLRLSGSGNLLPNMEVERTLFVEDRVFQGRNGALVETGRIDVESACFLWSIPDSFLGDCNIHSLEITGGMYGGWDGMGKCLRCRLIMKSSNRGGAFPLPGDSREFVHCATDYEQSYVAPVGYRSSGSQDHNPADATCRQSLFEGIHEENLLGVSECLSIPIQQP